MNRFRQAGNRFLGSLKGLQETGSVNLKGGIGFLSSTCASRLILSSSEEVSILPSFSIHTSFQATKGEGELGGHV
jgi:hypothetical protein